MATYLQGVTDYIPDYQPFQPDLNFYNNYLQTKQSQYDTNWKSLNNLYGQYFYADLTKESNIKKKEEMLTQIDFNLKRVAGLDLSLEQNVTQASQIFTPFYEDKFLMKDMAYTKNFMKDYAAVEGLKKSKKQETYSKYWAVGVKKMMYEREEFKNSTDEESLGFANVKYTPYVNAIEKYMKLGKESGISMDITESNGRYFIRQKNGDLIFQPLSNYFTSQFANDPALQDVYKAEAYVKRKDDILQNSEKFNGDLVAAERNYLTGQYATIQEYLKLKSAKNNEDKDVLENKLDNNNKKLMEGGGNEFTPRYAQSLEVSLGIAKDNAAYTDKLSAEVNDKASSTTTTTGATPDLANLDVLRFQVDAGVASMLAEQDIQQAAYSYSRVGMVKSMAADPYGVSAQNAAYAAQRQKITIEHQNRLAEAKDLKDKKNMMIEAGLANGSYIGMAEVKDENGKIIDYEPIPNPALNNRFVLAGKNNAGGITDKSVSVVQANKNMTTEFTAEYADGMVKQISSVIDSWVKSKEMTPDEANQYFFSSTGNVKAQPKNYKELLGRMSMFGKTFDETMGNVNDALAGTTNAKFLADYQANPASYLQGRGADLLQKTYSRVMQYAQATKGDVNGVSSTFLKTAPHSKFGEYIDYVRNNELVTKSNTDVIHKSFGSSTLMEAMPAANRASLSRLALNSDLTLVSKEDFIANGKNYFPEAKSFPEPKYGVYNKESLSNEQLKKLDKLLREEDEKAFKKYGPRGFGIMDGAAGYKRLSIASKDDITKKFQRDTFGMDGNGNKIQVNKESALGILYDDLTKIYSETIQNTKEMKLSSNLLTKDKANAVYNTAENGVGVNLAAVQSAGFRGFLETLDDAGKINFYDMKNNPISFFGNSKTGVKQTQDLYSDTEDIYTHVKIAELILNNYRSNIGKKDIKNFNLTSSQIAIEDLNKGAMTLYPTLDVLKELKAGEGAGLLTDPIINAIATNGISMISNRRNFNNWIFEGNQATPTESIINALGSISYSDPMGGGNFTIEKDESGVAPYKVYGTYLEMQADGSKKEVPFALPPVNYQNNIGLAQSTAKESLQRMADYNQLVWQQFQSKTFAPGISIESPESKRQFGNLR
jgi:hypothetical protein